MDKASAAIAAAMGSKPAWIWLAALASVADALWPVAEAVPLMAIASAAAWVAFLTTTSAGAGSSSPPWELELLAQFTEPTSL